MIESLNLRIQVFFVILISLSTLLLIPIISYITNWNTFNGNDLSNWTTVVFTLPIGIGVSLIFYVITSSNNYKRKIHALNNLFDNSFSMIGIWFDVQHDDDKGKLERIHNESQMKNINSLVNRITNMYHTNPDVLTKFGNDVYTIELVWDVIYDNRYEEKISDVLPMHLDGLLDTNIHLFKDICRELGKKKSLDRIEKTFKPTDSDEQKELMRDLVTRLISTSTPEKENKKKFITQLFKRKKSPKK